MGAREAEKGVADAVVTVAPSARLSSCTVEQCAVENHDHVLDVMYISLPTPACGNSKIDLPWDYHAGEILRSHASCRGMGPGLRSSENSSAFCRQAREVNNS